MMITNIGGTTPSTVWSYPNLHGDEVVTADNSGTPAAGHASYDPFGQPIDPTTGNIGTNSADDAVPNIQVAAPTAALVAGTDKATPPCSQLHV